MGYISLNKITPPEPPSDNYVDEQYAISNNWDTVDAKMAAIAGVGSVTGVETGQEIILSGRFNVWTGSAFKIMTQYSNAWTAWTALPLVGGANFVARPSFTPQYRINSQLRMGELTGGILWDAAASAWTHNSTNTVSSATPGVLGTSYSPLMTSYQTVSTSAVTATNDIQGARAILDNTNGWRLRIHFMGNTGGGNFVMLDRFRWWY